VGGDRIQFGSEARQAEAAVASSIFASSTRRLVRSTSTPTERLVAGALK